MLRPRLLTLARASKIPRRTIFNLFTPRAPPPPPPLKPLLEQDNLFHILENSPIPQLRKRAQTIKSLAPCPVCLDNASIPPSTAVSTGGTAATPTPSSPKVLKVDHACPDCGFPTHCTEGHLLQGRQAHAEYCGRLRELNEDEHDLRSGRLITEFQLPGAQDYETTPSLSNWDTLFYTRNFSSINGERAKRHASKLLTYPMTIASVLHRMGPYAGSRGGLDGRLTREGTRSMTALHTSLHAPLGADPSPTSRNAQIPIRIFILGARAESALPPHVYEQITHLFPYTQFHLYFIGPQAALPTRPLPTPQKPTSTQGADDKKVSDETTADDKKVFDETTPTQNSETAGRGRTETHAYGVPAYTIPVSSTLTLTTLQAPYEQVHDQFGPFDPYTDVFFAFCPGFGFPSPSAGRGALNTDGSPVLQAQAEWKETLQKVIPTKCPLFVTGFSPLDVERDVKSLDQVTNVAGEYDTILQPGENGFSSLKWEAGDFDTRVLVKVNWGVWGVRGKSYEVEAGKA